MVNRQSNRRKILIVDKGFQRKFILKFWLLISSSAILSGLLVYIFCGQSLTTVFRNSRLTIMSTADFIWPSFLLSSFVVIAVVGTATAIIALFISHRIAGPIYRMNKDLANFTSGHLKQVFRLRDKDEFASLVKTLNDMAKKVGGDMATIKEEVNYLEKLSSEDLPKRSQEHLKNLKRILNQYHV